MHPMNTAWQLAVVGAGPVGLALALHAARLLPHAHITVFDARPLDRDVAADPRTLALNLGSLQFLQRLGVAPGALLPGAQPITEVHVSQQPPSWGQAEVRLRSGELGVSHVGAVLRYGTLLAPLQAAWLAAAAAEPHRLHTRFGTPVAALKAEGSGVEVDAGVAERFDLAVVAEGGVFAEQARKALTHDYAQTAWVGTATLADATPGLAFERFTRQGPAALLPLPPAADGQARAALVWCVTSADDPVRDLSEAQRLAVLNTLFPPEAGRVVGLSPLKDFALGLNAERTLVDHRTVRIGNAAQTLHPVAGQGLNLGLRDAQALVAALRWADDLDIALRRVEWARAPDRWAMIAATDFLARSFTWQLPGAASARGLGLAALGALPPLKGWLARRMMFGG
ncbi:2-octaprenyl-6-methoxyphenyl hydroxylase [beta proteobacterium AAP121]|nr:2-octaprenyl-6-methoxyphenyl hydroxylase [beta proteobacterium AAP65]KPF98092.1 2-octaprenyl-6-methoxyphenyl hydroxylase [beta proteobacterium AAP121]